MSFLTGLAKFFELLNSNSGGLTFLITVVYVVATIAICIANIQSANASKKQLEEMQKQYAEENRPHIEVEFLFERRSFYGLRFINHGKSTAQNVEIPLSDAFIDSLGSTKYIIVYMSTYETFLCFTVPQGYRKEEIGRASCRERV